VAASTSGGGTAEGIGHPTQRRIGIIGGNRAKIGGEALALDGGLRFERGVEEDESIAGNHDVACVKVVWHDRAAERLANPRRRHPTGEILSQTGVLFDRLAGDAFNRQHAAGTIIAIAEWCVESAAGALGVGGQHGQRGCVLFLIETPAQRHDVVVSRCCDGCVGQIER
jgi:hypothetical protein